MIHEATVTCVRCGEPFGLGVDTGGEQAWVEDCPVCCRPMEICVRSRPGEIFSVHVTAA